MPNHFYTYIKYDFSTHFEDNILKQALVWFFSKHLNGLTLFQTIQFSISAVFWLYTVIVLNSFLFTHN